MHLRRWKSSDVTHGTRVFLRFDGNIPVKNFLAADGEKGRLAQAIPEITRLLAHGARVILATHLGDPAGKKSEEFSVIPVARLLQKMLGRQITMIPGLVGPEVERMVLNMKEGEVAMIENLRFDEGEEKNDHIFAASLARLADVYVNNAFGVCHRKHASVSAITEYLPSFAGELLDREVKELSKEPTSPFVLIMGGAKLSTKLKMIERFAPKADKILLGGAIAIPFLKGLDRSLPSASERFASEEDVIEAQSVLRRFMEKIVLPEDLVTDDDKIFDIGPQTAELFAHDLKGASTIIWNGPLGIVEEKNGQAGTKKIAEAIKKLSPARAIMGGGDTVAFLDSKDLLGGFTHVSTGGGAMLAFLGGEELPGLKPLAL
jgi:phosphoglycerate kinase